MSFNIGENTSRFVTVSNLTMRFKVSERMLFADLRTSRRTGRYKTDENGEVVTDAKGNPVPERVYSYWKGRFVGNALEPAKALQDGQTIDIVNGWLEKDVWTDKSGQRREGVHAVITDFVLSDSNGNNDDTIDVEAVSEEIENVFRALNGDGDTPRNGGRDI